MRFCFEHFHGLKRFACIAMKILAFIPKAMVIGAVVCLFIGHPSAASPIQLNGLWRFEMDPNSVGEQQQWYNRSFRFQINLPGILQSQNYGDPISTGTPWVLSLYDRYWYLRDDYKNY